MASDTGMRRPKAPLSSLSSFVGERGRRGAPVGGLDSDGYFVHDAALAQFHPILGDISVLPNDLLDGRRIKIDPAHDHHVIASAEDSAFERKRVIDESFFDNVSRAIAQQRRSRAAKRREDELAIFSIADGLSRDRINDLCE